MKRTLKSMTAAECSSERSRHRHLLGHLALQRMAPGKTAAELVKIDAEMVKHRRRIDRLDRQSGMVSRQAEVVA